MSEWSFEFDRGIVGNWPVDDRGEPVAPAFLEHLFGNETELALERNMLWAYGIPSVGRYPSDGALGKVVLGVSGFGLDIFVPETMLEDAKNIISADPSLNADLSDIDIIQEEENQ